ncbi:hypothetical protein LEMLEM_LOCUS6537, partial [Lemmus lemmus]
RSWEDPSHRKGENRKEQLEELESQALVIKGIPVILTSKLQGNGFHNGQVS